MLRNLKRNDVRPWGLIRDWENSGCLLLHLRCHPNLLSGSRANRWVKTTYCSWLALKLMAIQHGENVAKVVQQGRVRVTQTGWTLLSADGTANLKSRTHIRLQTRGKAAGECLALQYVNGVTTDGVTWTFTAPASTVNVGVSIQFRTGATWVEPVGDRVQIYGRMLNKAGATGSNTLNVIVVEYA